MSTVYVARDLRFSQVERLCAIKEIANRGPADELQDLRLITFEREASLLATLSHPAIPKIYDYFSEGGLVYLVLEFIEGEDLERLIERRGQPIDEATLIGWAIQILDVLAYLHEHQPEPIIFRDMKPSNIMLRTGGTISLIDFGIARTFQPLHRGTMIGTEGYAPPEQYRGIAEPRGDLYALGATLHHLATRSDPRGEPPFTFHQRPPRTLNPALSEPFEQVILRAVAYAPADRFPSAAAMTQALMAVRDVAEADTPAARTDAPLGDRVPAARPADDDLHLTVLPSNAERVIWSAQTGDEVRGSVTVDGGRAYVGSYDGHLYTLMPNDGVIAWRFRANRGIVSRPLCHDGLVIIGSEDHAIYALDAPSGRRVWSFRSAMPVRSSACAYGDAILIGADDGYCYCLDARQGHLLWRQRAWGPVRSSPVVVDDRVIVGSDDGTVYAFTVVDGHPRWRARLGGPVLSSPELAGDLVVIGCADGGIYALDAETGERRWTHQTDGPVIASPRSYAQTIVVGSTDGKLYALSASDGMIIWDRQIANQITGSVATLGPMGYVGTVDGNVYAINLDDGTTRWVHRLDGPVVSTPGVAGGVIIVGSLDGRIYGLRA